MIFSRLAKTAQRRRNGALALITVMSLIPVTSMYSASVNTGQMIEDKRRAQDGADAIAMMHSTWAARSLNTISMNNVTATQLLTVAIGAEALDATLTEMLGRAAQAQMFTSEMKEKCNWYFWPKLVKACKGYQQFVGGWAAVTTAYATYIYAAYSPKHGASMADKGLRAIDAMNRAIVDRFPKTMRELSNRYATSYDLEAVHFVAACEGRRACPNRKGGEGMSLPVTRNEVFERLERCDAMRAGTDTFPLRKRLSYTARGFVSGKGPMDHGGSNRYPHVRDHIENITNIDWFLWAHQSWFETIPYFPPIYLKLLPKKKNFKGEQEEGDNSFTRYFNSKHQNVCPHDFRGFGSGLSFYDAYARKLHAKQPVSFWAIGQYPKKPGTKDYRKMPEDYQVLVIVQTKDSAHIGADLIGSKTAPHFGYAQSVVYNPDGADLYTQNWRAKMTPAWRMNDLPFVAQDIRDHAPRSFVDLAKALEAANDTQDWSRLNAH